MVILIHCAEVVPLTESLPRIESAEMRNRIRPRDVQPDTVQLNISFPFWRVAF